MKSIILPCALCLVASSAWANSSWVDCAIYSPGYSLRKIEIQDGLIESRLAVNGVRVEVLSSSRECEASLRCNIAKGYPIKFALGDSAATLVLSRGDVLKHEWIRGEAHVFEVASTVSYKGEVTSMVGACFKYN